MEGPAQAAGMSVTLTGSPSPPVQEGTPVTFNAMVANPPHGTRREGDPAGPVHYSFCVQPMSQMGSRNCTAGADGSASSAFQWYDLA